MSVVKSAAGHVLVARGCMPRRRGRVGGRRSDPHGHALLAARRTHDLVTRRATCRERLRDGVLALGVLAVAPVVGAIIATSIMATAIVLAVLGRDS